MPTDDTIGSPRVLVLGDYRQTVTVVRSLARAGYQVILGTADPRGPSTRSRYLSGLWIYDGSSASAFCDHLERYLRATPTDFVFPVGETLLRALAADPARFGGLATWVAPAWATLERCFNKNTMYAHARRLGIPTAPWCSFSSPARWRHAARRMGFPVVVKRRDSSAQVRGRKAIICKDGRELESVLALLPHDPAPHTLLLQKFVPGLRHNCHFAASRGRLIAYFEQQVLRTDEPDHTGIGLEGISVRPTPELYMHCARLVRSLDYHGIGCIQFLVDAASGNATFLELNARMDSTAALPYRLGYDFPRFAVELAAERLRHLPLGYRCGQRYHWLYGDLLAFQETVRRRDKSRFALAVWALRSTWVALASHHLTWDIRDPLPTLNLFWRKFASAAAKRLRLAAT